VTQLSLIPFYLRCAGRTELARMTGVRDYETTDSDGDSKRHFAVDLTSPDTGPDSVEIDVTEWALIGQREGISLPIRYASRGNWNLGASPTMPWPLGAFVAAASIVFWVIYARRRVSSRPWFRRRVNDKGSGPLPDPESASAGPPGEPT
jgi:hypothetical protein